MIDGYEVWKTYIALKLHFSKEAFDYFKYGVDLKSTDKANYLKRNDRHFYYRLGTKFTKTDDLLLFFVANFVAGNDWIGKMKTETFQERRGVLESLDYKFRNDLEYITDVVTTLGYPLKELVIAKDFGKDPLLLQMYLQGQITLESLSIMHRFTYAFEQFDKAGLIVWNSIRLPILKYQPFMQPYCNWDKYKSSVATALAPLERN